MLLRGVPIRIVASMHNTSVSQIERHYSALIRDHADDLTRRRCCIPNPWQCRSDSTLAVQPQRLGAPADLTQTREGAPWSRLKHR